MNRRRQSDAGAHAASRWRGLGLAIGAAVVGPLVILSIWYPVVAQYYVPTIEVGDRLLERSRQAPSDAAFDDISTAGFLMPLGTSSDREVLALADGILAGVLGHAGDEQIPIHVPFERADLEAGSGRMQLAVAALAVPRLLLEAYEISGEEIYFDAAAAALVSYAEHDRATWIPRGLQWNDHALAARVAVVASFWKRYRSHPSYTDDIGRLVVAFADRSGRLLAKPGLFTFATNHGVMQNIGLLHLALTFPELPDAADYAELGARRLRSQMPYYVSPEGVVLEHSLGYHVGGTNLLSAAVLYLRQLEIPVPEVWTRKLAAAMRFERLIRRPDGSLPRVGDTAGDEALLLDEPVAPPPPLPVRMLETYPISGYGVIRAAAAEDAGATHALMAWSNFDGHGHKHADELSVVLWAHGREWWSNPGYWPYENPLRDDAVGWQGGNAPHRIGEDPAPLRAGETATTPRKSRLIAEGVGGSLAVLDVVRTSTDGYSVRRQLIQIGNDLWIVADQHDGAGESGGRVVWTAAEGLDARPADGAGCYVFEPMFNSLKMLSCVLVSENGRVRLLRGGTEPFAGWLTRGRQVRPSMALMVDGAGDAPWSISVWRLIDGAPPSAPVTAVWEGAEDWSLAIPGRGETLRVARDGESISVTGDAARAGRVALRPVADPADEIAAIRESFVAANDAYPRFRATLLPYRLKATVWLLIGWIVQELGLAALTIVRPAWAAGPRLASAAAWLAGGVWLHLRYFVV